jgi:hypothetical protein
VLLSGYLSARLTGFVTDPATVGAAEIELAYSIDGGATFTALTSPLSVTPSGVVYSDWVDMPASMQDDVIITARTLGGGGTASCTLASLAAQFSTISRSGGGTPPDTDVASVDLSPTTLDLTLPPGPWDDPFDYGTALDTTGARFGGAMPWTLDSYYPGGFTSEAIVSSEWRIQFQTNGLAFQPQGAFEDLPAGDWEFELTGARMAVASREELIGIYLTETSSGKQRLFGPGKDSTTQYMQLKANYGAGSNNVVYRQALGGAFVPSTSPFATEYDVSLRIARVGSTITYKYKAWNGSTGWVSWYSESITTGFDSEPNRIGPVVSAGEVTVGTRTAWFANWRRVDGTPGGSGTSNSGSVTATPKNALGVPLTGKFIAYNSSNPAVASVSIIGPNQARVVGIIAGTTDVTAECDGITSNVCAVTVG